MSEHDDTAGAILAGLMIGIAVSHTSAAVGIALLVLVCLFS